MSKLRVALAPHGVALERRGGGYRVDLGQVVLDSQLFKAFVEDATRAAAAGDHARASAGAQEALGLWRGPVLAGVPLGPDGRAAVEQLVEQRWRAIEIRADAELALERHAELVGELRRLLEESPYRERLVAQLMLALYRSGRQAEALDVYERTRRRLGEDLGLQPSPELQRLAGQIVRQDRVLRAPSAVDRAVARPAAAENRPRRRVLARAAAVAATAVAVSLVLVLWIGSGAGGSNGPPRVALIRLWDPGAVGSRRLDPGWDPFVDGLLAAQRTQGVETEIIDLFPRRPASGGFEQGSSEDVERLSRRLESGDFDFVLWPLGLPGTSFYDVVSRHPGTRFAFLDYCCAGDAPLNGAPNVTAITLRTEQAAHLAGYLSGLMEARRPPSKGRGNIVSSVTGEPDYPQERGWAQGFVAGARRALPNVDVLVDYSYDYENPATCEAIANEQIEAGSGVVFAGAGKCGRGALSAAAVRGAWGVAAAEDLSYLGPHILASATKRYDRLTEVSIAWLLAGRLPPGGDVELGLADDAVALVGISPDVPEEIRRKVAQEAARLRVLETS